jgi:hypothetical protein
MLGAVQAKLTVAGIDNFLARNSLTTRKSQKNFPLHPESSLRSSTNLKKSANRKFLLNVSGKQRIKHQVLLNPDIQTN